MRRALLLSNADSEVTKIFQTALMDRKETLAALQTVDDERVTIVKDYKAREAKLLEQVEARIKAMGITVFDAKNHEVSFSPEEGVVWLESKEEKCQCPFCRLMVVVQQ